MKRIKAVALSYPEGASAPFITAGGTGRTAAQILRIAKEHNVEVVENSDLADVLSLYDIGVCIPPETYEAVAGIFVFLKKFEGKNGKNSA